MFSCIFVRYMAHLLGFSGLVDTATLCTVTIGSRKRVSGSLLCPFIQSMFAMLAGCARKGAGNLGPELSIHKDDSKSKGLPGEFQDTRCCRESDRIFLLHIYAVLSLDGG